MDHNDNNPVCYPPIIELCINESHPLNAEVTKVNCSDPDSTIVGEGMKSGKEWDQLGNL